MRTLFLLAAMITSVHGSEFILSHHSTLSPKETKPEFQKESWEYFLQHLPISKGTVVDYRGKPVEDQEKQEGILSYDVGTRDLQQCADAIMRLRAEYLYDQQLYNKISFHFTNGDAYSFKDYCKGKRPQPSGNSIRYRYTDSIAISRSALRKYLDIVYSYAGTISLHKELKPAKDFTVGTIIITPGSPGHCCIIVDEKRNEKGERFFKLVEGYTPAQTMYLLSNPYDPANSPWYQLKKGVIETASYRFVRYDLKKF